jgi:type VI secretion system protein ImpG
MSDSPQFGSANSDTVADALLPYYNRELDTLRRLAGEFAQAHPKIAGRLCLSPDAVDDPHLARLLEGVVFLGARVQHRLDDEFPELTDALANVLYPHYLAAVPSCAIAQLQCQPDLGLSMRLPADVALDTEKVRGEACRFRTARPLTLWPIKIESVRLLGLPLAAPTNPRAAGAVSVLRIVLKTAAPNVTFSTLGVDRLRFFLRAPASLSLPLLELLGAHAVSVAYADRQTDPAPVILPGGAIEPVGFSAEDVILPWPARSFSGLRLLREYFAFPEKFLFVDFAGIESKTLLGAGKRLEISVYLDRALPDLERLLGTDALALGCTPVVDLFPQRCEPVPLTHENTEYRVVPDARRPSALEVWQIERVQERTRDGASRPWRPFHRLTHAAAAAGPAGGSWHATRRSAPATLGGTETFLGLHGMEIDPDRPADSVFSVDVPCLNRDLPAHLPFGGGHPFLRVVEANASVARTLPDRADADAAGATARGRVLAAGLASFARPSLGGGWLRGCRGIERGSAAL